MYKNPIYKFFNMRGNSKRSFFVRLRESQPMIKQQVEVKKSTKVS